MRRMKRWNEGRNKRREGENGFEVDLIRRQAWDCTTFCIGNVQIEDFFILNWCHRFLKDKVCSDSSKHAESTQLRFFYECTATCSSHLFMPDWSLFLMGKQSKNVTTSPDGYTMLRNKEEKHFAVANPTTNVLIGNFLVFLKFKQKWRMWSLSHMLCNIEKKHG